jgi:hypothetical protein
MYKYVIPVNGRSGFGACDEGRGRRWAGRGEGSGAQTRAGATPNRPGAVGPAGGVFVSSSNPGAALRCGRDSRRPLHESRGCAPSASAAIYSPWVASPRQVRGPVGRRRRLRRRVVCALRRRHQVRHVASRRNGRAALQRQGKRVATAGRPVPAGAVNIDPTQPPTAGCGSSDAVAAGAGPCRPGKQMAGCSVPAQMWTG